MRLRRGVPLVNPGPLLRGLALAWESAPGWLVVQLTLCILQGAVPLAMLYLTKLIVDGVSGAVTGGTVTFGQVGLLILATAIVAAVGAAIRALGAVVTEVQSLRLSDRVHEIIHAKSVEIDLQFYESATYHDTLHRALEEAPYRPARIVDAVSRVIQNAVGAAGVAGLLIGFHWSIAVVLFVAALPAVAIKAIFSRRFYDWTLRQTPVVRKTRYLNGLLTGAAAAKELRLFDLGGIFQRRFRDLRAVVRKERLSLVTRRSLLDLLAQIVAIAAVFGALAFVARDALLGSITAGAMVMYFAAFQRGQEFLRDAMGGLASLYEDNLFLTDLDAFLKIHPAVTEPTNPRPFPRPIQLSVVLDNVSFRYPGSERTVLEDVSLEIKPGEHVALVGENGSGKTTLVKLLCRLYDPTGGALLVDGIDLREFARSDLRKEIGVVFQDYAKYSLTVRENIWLGNVGLPADSPRIAEAAIKTSASEMIGRLPHGYDTMLGRENEHGAELSIGEWQKLAIARAFVRDSSIIVLDEPTASLDARAEAQVFEQFNQLTKGRTAILISHRLSTVRMADRIFVLDRGRIIEAGCHDELMERGGHYAGLFELQARHYR